MSWQSTTDQPEFYRELLSAEEEAEHSEFWARKLKEIEDLHMNEYPKSWISLKYIVRMIKRECSLQVRKYFITARSHR